MKSFEKILGLAVALSLTLGLLGPIAPTSAALAPGFLGLTSTYAVFGAAGITGGAASTVWGDTGENGFGDGTITAGTLGTYYPAAQPLVVSDRTSAYGALVAETPTGIVDLSTPTSVGPGVYTVSSSTFNQTLTLTGAGTYVFQRASNIAQTAGGTMVLAGGACASNVYWQTSTGMTFAAGGNIEGTIIAETAITFADSSLTFKGRALTDTTVALGGITITEPVCAVPPAPSSGSAEKGYINVVKNVINDNGGTKVVSDFPLLVNGQFIASGVTNVFGASNNESFEYKVTETQNAGYTQSFSGDCDAQGIVRLDPDETLFCIITNDDIGAPTPIAPVPPLIEVVKVPNPLALPGGPGNVQYTYTLRNIGTVPASNITMVGDTCSPIALISGDTNNNSILDLNETWVHTCSTTLTETHTNTVVATGWANGISAVDIASATVIVGASTVPPLIHITKTPNKFTLATGGGMITYNKKVTNPGTIPLSNVQVSDDKCPAVKYISGDTDLDNMLDTSETWTYTCSTNITKTTTNTAVATGVANGQIARDFALATVTVANAVPALPNTGTAPAQMNLLRNILIAAGLLIITSAGVIAYRRKQAL